MRDLLIVDDEKLIRDGLVTYIDWASLGIRVAGICATATEALKAARETHVDIVLTDVRMPGMDGIELLKKLKRARPRCEVVFISAYRTFEYARNALHYGAFDYVLKPIEESVLYETMRRCVRQLEVPARGGTDAPDPAAFDELRLYLAAGLRDADLWARLSRSLGIPLVSPSRLDLVRALTEGSEGAAAAATAECLSSLEARGIGAVSLRLDRDEGIILSYGEGRQGDGHRAEAPSEGAGSRAPFLVGTSVGPAMQDPARLYLEASWAVVALYTHPGRDHMEWAEVKAALARRPPSPVTPGELVEALMAEDEPDLDALTWRVFAPFAREADDAGLTSIRLSVSRLVEAAVDHLASYPGLSPAVPGLGSLHAAIARERSLCGIHARTREGLEELIATARRLVSPGVSRRIAEAVSLVREDPKSGASLSAVARRLLVSPGYLSRTFRRETAESFSRFRSRTRIERACELFRDHRHKIYEVADLVGFKDVTHFTRVFTRMMGMSPSEYRRRPGRAGGGATP